MHLIVYRNHDGYLGMLHFLKMQLSMLHISGSDLKISPDPVAPLGRQIQSAVFSRMEHGILKILKNLSLSCLLGQNFIHSLMAFAENFPHDGLMFRQILEGFGDLPVFPAQISDDDLQVRHMVVGKALNLLLLDDGHVLFFNLQLQVLAPFLYLIKLTLPVQKKFQRFHRLLILLHILEGTAGMDIGLKVLLHGRKNFLFFFIYSKMSKNFFLPCMKHALIPAVKVQKIPVMKEFGRNREGKDPFIIDSVNLSV